jgi:hypothetical protein
MSYKNPYEVKSKEYKFNGIKWPVMGIGGIDTRNLNRIFQQVDVMLYKYSRIFILRFDLRPVEHSPNNDQMGVFRRRLLKRLEAKYNIATSDMAFCWCREQEKAKGQHYHWFLIVDGKKIRSMVPSAGIGELIIDIYNKLDGSVHLAGYHNVNRSDIDKQKKALYHLSYLAKTRGKGYAGTKVKNFASSKTQYPDGEIGNARKGLYLVQKKME